MKQKYLVAVDGSEQGWKALDLSADLAKHTGADLLILHVVPFEPIPKELADFAAAEHISMGDAEVHYLFSRRVGDQITKDAKIRALKVGAERCEVHVAEGKAANQILEIADTQGATMIFLGSRGLGDLKGLLMGSVSHKVMQMAKCTCVAVK